MSNGQELVLHKKLFRQLTTDELYELLSLNEFSHQGHRGLVTDID